jgi:hypothetical protein
VERAAEAEGSEVKRLEFQKDFVPDILSGKKQFTSRLKTNLGEGDIVAAVTAQNGKPGFLTPAADRFATLKILSVESKFWKDFTDDDADDCNVQKAWYTNRYGIRLTDMTRIHKIQFEVQK